MGRFYKNGSQRDKKTGCGEYFAGRTYLYTNFKEKLKPRRDLGVLICRKIIPSNGSWILFSFAHMRQISDMTNDIFAMTTRNNGKICLYRRKRNV